MLATDIPSVFNIPWANSATVPYVHAVPEASQVAITPGAASLTDGFPPLNFQSYTAGGIPPFGNDLNGILRQITAWQRWTQAGGYPRYNAAYQTAIGGYPSGAVLMAATNTGLWVSSVDSNMTNPDTGGAGWSWMNGSSSQPFNVGAATAAAHAVQLKEVSLIATVASAPTVDIFGAAGATIDIDNTTPVTITEIATCTAAQVGSTKRVIVRAGQSLTVTAATGANKFSVDGATSGNTTYPANAILEVYAASTTSFQIRTLSAYGTWTPVFAFGGGGVTYTATGYYSCMNGLMECTAKLVLTSIAGSPTGLISIIGIPRPPRDATLSGRTAVSLSLANFITGAGLIPNGYFVANLSRVEINTLNLTTGAVAAGNAATMLTASTEIDLSFKYFA